MTTQPVSDELLQQIRKRLMETGDWERISRALRTQLDESGWEDDVKDLAKERARAQENPNLQSLVQEITPDANEMVRNDVRAAVLQEIEAALERQVEKA